MIGKLTGQIDSVGKDSVILNVQGVGYLVSCSSRTLDQLTVGESSSLTIDTYVREDQITLYGFLDDQERKWFKILQAVQGVGARVALAILGLFPISRLIEIISAGDKSSISRTPGVGPKLAQRIVIELRDKVAHEFLLSGVSNNHGQLSKGDDNPSIKIKESVSALINLGYPESQAISTVTQVASEVGEDTISVETLIRASLTKLGSGDKKILRGSG